MDIRVHGKHMQVSEDLRETAIRKLDHASRIFGETAFADVEFAEHRNPRIDARFGVEITARVAGHDIRVEAAAGDDRTALDQASDKYERALRRLKERLIQRSRKGSHKQLNEDLQPAEDIISSGGPSIVRVKQFAMKPMMPEEAALQMDMLDHSFFFFLNGETDRYGVLYQRRDGSLGLIEHE